MTIRLLTSADDMALYSTWMNTHPDATLWQSLEWKTYQEALGRRVLLYAVISDRLPVTGTEENIVASAMVIIDKTMGGYTTWDIPRGPVGPQMENGEWRMENFLERIITDAKQDKCISLFYSPAHSFPILNPQFSILNSSRHEQPEATRILDISVSEEDILKQMHQKGRYNMKVAEKNGVRVEQSNDVEAYAKMASDTAKRDGFTGGTAKRYKAFLENIPGSFLLLAYAGENASPIAGLIGVVHNKTGIYYYGASNYNHRALMAPYLLQWEAIKHCKKAGCTHYDLLGIAPPLDDPESRKLEARSSIHPWSGISDFKAKFGGEVILYPPEQEIVLKPFVKRILMLKRAILG